MSAKKQSHSRPTFLVDLVIKDLVAVVFLFIVFMMSETKNKYLYVYQKFVLLCVADFSLKRISEQFELI